MSDHDANLYYKLCQIAFVNLILSCLLSSASWQNLYLPPGLATVHCLCVCVVTVQCSCVTDVFKISNKQSRSKPDTMYGFFDGIKSNNTSRSTSTFRQISDTNLVDLIFVARQMTSLGQNTNDVSWLTNYKFHMDLCIISNQKYGFQSQKFAKDDAVTNRENMG